MATLCLSGHVVLKAGANAPTLTESNYTELINQAEGFVCTQARKDYVTLSGSLSTIGRAFLKDLVSNKAAIDLVKNNMKGFTSRAEAQTIINVLWNTVTEQINLLKEDKFKDFVMDGTA